MSTLKYLILPFALIAYSLTLIFTEYSLVGFWTDIFFSIVLIFATYKYIFKYKVFSPWVTVTTRITSIVFSIILSLPLFLSIIDPFAWDTLKLRSFMFQKVDSRVFCAYFKPVGAYAGGEGNFWITEIPIYFPVIEKTVYYEKAVLWNFNSDEFDGRPVDNKEVVNEYIRQEVLNKPGK